MSDIDLKELLARCEAAVSDARSRLQNLHKQVTIAETQLLEVKLDREKILAAIKRINDRTVDHTPDERDLELAAFRIRMPELLDRLPSKNNR